MESTFSILVAWLMSSTALGVGSSTLAISSFMVALLDHTIDVSERRMLGVIYWSLRSAMIMMACALLLLVVLYPGAIDSAVYIWILWVGLVLNAILMTKHLMPHKIGPALQAAIWYTVGFVLTIEGFSLFAITPASFAILFVADFLFALVVVNGLLFWMKRRSV